MPQDLPYWLHSVSVVVTAEFHNPSILNPDFLESKEIVPSDWTGTEAITTPQVSFVRYENEIQLGGGIGKTHCCRGDQGV